MLGDDALRDCLKALRNGKVTGWDNVPVEAYRGSVKASVEAIPHLSLYVAHGV